MRLFIKNKFLSIKGNSEVLDENNKPVYMIKGKLFSITKKKYIKDLEGNTLYMIRNKFWHWLTHSVYIYDNNKNKIAQLKARLRFSQRYDLIGYKDELKITGKPFSLNCQIYKNEEILGSIRREFFKLTDCFILDIEKDEDATLFVALVIGIDNITDQNENEN